MTALDWTERGGEGEERDGWGWCVMEGWREEVALALGRRDRDWDWDETELPEGKGI